MRDPKRIKRILDKIEKIWELRPDLRFGQIDLDSEEIEPDDTMHCPE